MGDSLVPGRGTSRWRATRFDAETPVSGAAVNRVRKAVERAKRTADGA